MNSLKPLVAAMIIFSLFGCISAGAEEILTRGGIASVLPWDSAVSLRGFREEKRLNPDTGAMIGSSTAKWGGSGTVVWEEGDWLMILTAKHVVDKATRVQVSRGPYSAEAREFTTHKTQDVAYFWIKSPELANILEPAALFDGVLEIGDELWQYGDALSMGLRASKGLFASDEPKPMGKEILWRMSTPIYPGCSGAALFYNGRIAGVAVRVINSGGNIYSDLGLFVGIFHVREIMNNVIEDGPPEFSNPNPKIEKPKISPFGKMGPPKEKPL